MRRLMLATLALLAGSAFVTPAAEASWVSYECHKFVYCTVYGPGGEEIVSVDEVQAAVRELLPA